MSWSPKLFKLSAINRVVQNDMNNSTESLGMMLSEAFKAVVASRDVETIFAVPFLVLYINLFLNQGRRVKRYAHAC